MSAAASQNDSTKPIPLMLSHDKAHYLRQFATYYRDNYLKMVRDADTTHTLDSATNDANIFSAPALSQLFDTYCAGSVLRLYDSITKGIPFLSVTNASPLSILDVTCFATTQIFPLMFPNATIHSCDKHLKWERFLEGVTCRLCNLEHEQLPYTDDSFDLVVFTETMEHIPRSPYDVLGEIRRVLKPDGVLIFSVPNLSNVRNRLKLLLGRDILSVELGHGSTFGHFREYNMREVEHLFKVLDMRILQKEYLYYNSAQTAMRFRGLPYAVIQWLIDESLCRVVPSLRPACLAIATKQTPAPLG